MSNNNKNQNNESEEEEVSAEQVDQGDELEQCKKKSEEYLDGWKRAQADFINYKKEEVKRFEDLVKYSSEALIKELLIIFDSFDLAATSLEGNAGAQKGVYIIKSQLQNILKNRGLERVSVSAGEEAFNPHHHEAVGEIESDKPQGTILEIVEDGYVLHGKVIRPARVLIAK